MARIVGVGPLICRAMDSNEGYTGTVMEDTFHIWLYGIAWPTPLPEVRACDE